MDRIVGELSADELVTGLMQQRPQSNQTATFNPQSSERLAGHHMT